MGPRCSSAETQVCHRSYIIAAKRSGTHEVNYLYPRVPVAFPKQVVNQFKNNNNIEYDDLIQNGKSEKSKTSRELVFVLNRVEKQHDYMSCFHDYKPLRSKKMSESLEAHHGSFYCLYFTLTDLQVTKCPP